MHHFREKYAQPFFACASKNSLKPKQDTPERIRDNPRRKRAAPPPPAGGVNPRRARHPRPDCAPAPTALRSAPAGAPRRENISKYLEIFVQVLGKFFSSTWNFHRSAPPRSGLRGVLPGTAHSRRAPAAGRTPQERGRRTAPPRAETATRRKHPRPGSAKRGISRRKSGVFRRKNAETLAVLRKVRTFATAKCAQGAFRLAQRHGPAHSSIG